jgi:soluble lytic murein transglycosylase
MAAKRDQRLGWQRATALAVGVLGLAIVAGGVTRLREADAANEPVQLVSATDYVAPVALPMGELSLLQSGLAAADAGRWSEVAAIASSAADPLVRRFLQWRLAVDESAPHDFSVARDALEELEGWPGRSVMRERLERMAFDSGLSAADLAALLSRDGGPVSGDGKVALARSYRTLGRAQEASALVRDAWRNDRLSTRAQGVISDDFSGVLTQEDNAIRVDVLLWRGEHAAARALLPSIGYHERLVAEARIALQTRPRRGLQAAVDRVPSSHADHPGFLYDRARYIIRSGRWDDAAPYVSRINALNAPLIGRDEIFTQKRAFVTRALRAGDPRRAYGLTQNHGMTAGEQFADAEFVAGWLSLRKLGQPEQAEIHFRTLAQGVSSPISLARGYYWLGAAHAAQGETAERNAAFATAAQYDYTYYGQMAAVETNPNARIAYPTAVPIPRATQERFENRELVRVLRFIATAGDRQDFERIAFFLDDQLTDPGELELLGQLARDNGYALTAVRHGKAGLFRGVMAPNAAYPVIDLPANARQSGRPEPAFVHAIIRQESEFDPRAVSHAGARGLMQLMPATARITANREGISYSLAALTDDPQYNIILGARHLQDLLDEWNGSYILVAASYNAGSGRAREWIADFGDPRTGAVDPVDWVEMIPFSETRNYVQRVMENMQVYRHRITGEPAAIGLRDDLRRGR